MAAASNNQQNSIFEEAVNPNSQDARNNYKRRHSKSFPCHEQSFQPFADILPDAVKFAQNLKTQSLNVPVWTKMSFYHHSYAARVWG